MLIKITESCTMGCTHCMNDAKPNGLDMTLGMAQKVVDFIVEEYKGTRNYVNVFVISGGEPTEHKEFLKIMDILINGIRSIKGIKSIVIATNGEWVLKNKSMARSLVGKSSADTYIMFQVSTDRRFYPRRIDVNDNIFKSEGFQLVDDCVTWVYPIGRAKDNGMKTKYTSTACFNVRASARQLDECTDDLHFVDVLDVLNSKGKICTPAIDVMGNIKLGESDLCPVCSNIFRRSEDIISDIVAFKCKKCYPLNTGLPVELRRLIGEV